MAIHKFGEVTESLWATIESRKSADPLESYTAALLTGHEDKLLKKLGEEATEVVMAAKDKNPEGLRWEAADLFYHLLVTLARNDVSLDDLAAELESRFK